MCLVEVALEKTGTEQRLDQALERPTRYKSVSWNDRLIDEAVAEFPDTVLSRRKRQVMSQAQAEQRQIYLKQLKTEEEMVCRRHCGMN
jgi:hypothetical protein